MFGRFALLSLLGCASALSSACAFSAEAWAEISFTTSATLTAHGSHSDAKLTTGSGFAHTNFLVDSGAPVFKVWSAASGDVPSFGTSAASQFADVTIYATNNSASTVTGSYTLTFFSDSKAFDFGVGNGDFARANSGLSALGSLLNGVTSTGASSEGASSSLVYDSESGTLTGFFSLRPWEQKSVQIKSWAEGYAEPVPEPASMAALGLGALAALRRRKRNA